MNCPDCQAENPAEAKFCMKCGSALAVTCPDCATELPAEAQFCYKCGHQLAVSQTESRSDAVQDKIKKYIPKELMAKLESARDSGGMQGERRTVTVLFCDVTGSTEMAEGLDPEEWAEIMDEAFDYLISPVYRYEGTLARLMGDAILAFFGAPIAHEDDPQRAILAGLDIVEGIKPFSNRIGRDYNIDFNVRVGINTGPVVVGEIGSDMAVEYTAMGDAVNLGQIGKEGYFFQEFKHHTVLKYWWTKLTAIAPSPTAEATLLIASWRMSPAANMPGTLVSSRKGSRLGLQLFGR